MFKKSRSSPVASFSNYKCIIVMPLSPPNKYTTLSPNTNAGSFDHWSLPVLGTLASCNSSETCQTWLPIRPMSCLFVKLVFWWASVNTTPSLQYWLRLLSFRNHRHLPHNFRWLNSSLILYYHCHQECYDEELGKKKKRIACDVYLMFCVECSWRGWAGPSAGGEGGASEAGTSSAVAAHPGCSPRQRPREVRLIRWCRWCVV